MRFEGKLVGWLVVVTPQSLAGDFRLDDCRADKQTASCTCTVLCSKLD